MFGMLSVFADLERHLLISRVRAGVARAQARGVRFGRPPTPPERLEKVRRDLLIGSKSIRKIAKDARVSTATVQRVKRSLNGQERPLETAGATV